MAACALLLVASFAAMQPAPQPPAAPVPQQSAPSPSAPAQAGAQGAAPAPAPSAQAPAPPETYAYDPAGRRDPFVNLLGTGLEQRSTLRKGDGPAAMTAADISLNGILQSRGKFVALIKGPDNRTYIVHKGDKLLDGTITTITAQGLVILQEVNDPLSLVKQREVRKLLRSPEDAKE
jgi:type IV pilus assembly protein PilP